MNILRNILAESKKQVALHHEMVSVEEFGSQYWKKPSYAKMKQQVDLVSSKKWTNTLRNVNRLRTRSGPVKRGPVATGVITEGRVSISKETRKLLAHVPKYNPVIRPSTVDVIAAVRKAASHAPQGQQLAFIDLTLDKTSQERFPKYLRSEKQQVSQAIKEMKDKKYKLLEADKESKFVVMHRGPYNTKADAALKKSFNKIGRNSTNLVTNKGKVLDILRTRPGSEHKFSWYNKVKSNGRKYLRTFFKIKIHKPERGFRAIVKDCRLPSIRNSQKQVNSSSWT